MAPAPLMPRPSPKDTLTDKPDDRTDIVYGSKTYLNEVYKARHGGRAHPSEANTLRAGDVLRQHLENGPPPSPAFRSSKQDERLSGASAALKIPKQRSRSQTSDEVEEREHTAWDNERKIAMSSLKMPMVGPVKKNVARRASALHDHMGNSTPPALRNGKNEVEKQTVKSSNGPRRNIDERHKTVHGDGIARSVSKDVDVDKVFTAAADEQLAGKHSPISPPPADDPEPTADTIISEDAPTASRIASDTKPF